MGRNRQNKLNGSAQKFKGTKDGVDFIIYARQFKDKRKRIVRVLSGPCLREVRRKTG